MRKNKFVVTAFACYSLLLVWLVIFKLEFDPANLPRYRQLILVPFSERSGISMSAVMEELVMNVLAFIPLGVYLSALEMPKKAWQRVLVGFGFSLVFELIQLAFARGTTAVTDLINNTLGTLLGVLLFALIKKLLKEKAAVVSAAVLFALQAVAFGGYLFLYLANF